MLYLLVVIYLWAGLTCSWHLWQIEGVGVAINRIAKEGDKPINPVLRKRPLALLVIALIWPIVFPWQAFREIL